MHRSVQSAEALSDISTPNFQIELRKLPELPGRGDIEELKALRSNPASITIDPKLKDNAPYVEHPLFFRYSRPISTKSEVPTVKSSPILFESGLGSSSLSLIVSSEGLRKFAKSQSTFCEYKTLAGCSGNFRNFQLSTIDRRSKKTLRWISGIKEEHGAPHSVSFSGSACGTLEGLGSLSSNGSAPVRSLTLLSPFLFMHPSYASQVKFGVPLMNAGNWLMKQLRHGPKYLSKKEWLAAASEHDYAKHPNHIIDDIEYLDITYSKIPAPVVAQLPQAAQRARTALTSLIQTKRIDASQVLAIFGDSDLETAIDVRKSVQFLEGLGIQCVEIKEARHRPQLTHLGEVEAMILAHIKQFA